MNTVHLTQATSLGPLQGLATMIVIGVVLLCLVYYVKRRLVTTTRDFVIANRKIGFGFGVAGLISIWTWSMAVMMSSGLTFQYGLSGLFWFTVPNGLAVIAIIPFAKKIRQVMPEGYTIAQFVSSRFDHSKAAATVVTIGMLFGSIIEITINLKGTSLVVSSIFGLDPRAAAAAGIAIVLVYSLLGGLWASMTNATLVTLFRAVPAAIIAIGVLQFVGGATPVWNGVAAHGASYLSVTRPDVASGFGITLALGILTASLAGQEFWQVVWGLKKKEVSRTFLWAGAWFYPIPICFGALGLVALALNVDVNRDLGGDTAAVGPFVVSHLGLPTWMVYTYAAVILTACYSTIDSALCAFSSTCAVNIIKPLVPSLADRPLLLWSKSAMAIAAVIAAAIVLTGADFNTIVLTSYAIRTAILIPLMLAIFWPRMNVSGFVWGTAAAIAIGMPIRARYGELAGTAAILLVSALVPIVLGLLNRKRFDYAVLSRQDDVAATPDTFEAAVSHSGT